MTIYDLVLRGRRPTDLFAAALFSFQGANLNRSPYRKRINSSVLEGGCSSHDGYSIAAHHSCQARLASILRAPTYVRVA
jgi:hypothetical protein